ncbi:MAG: DHHW family protein [Pseudoflavonifractor sp.]|nr:DHHW family protein [Alloprevotella sp.]MCM1117515.1 DHHW family protein [Pseudoflavonifractor sp.]
MSPTFLPIILLSVATLAIPVPPGVHDEDDDIIDIDFMHAEMASLSGGPSIDFNTPADEYVNSLTADAPFRRARRGILIVGSGDSLRAMEPFKGSSSAIEAYAAAINEYASRLPDSVRLYCMPVPTAVAYYCPDEATRFTASPRTAMLRLFSSLDRRVTPVDIYPTLGKHAAEPIYSRTDHHWAPLGAYYAAGCFASAAGTPFLPLSYYSAHCVDGYVGTMAKFSADRAVSNAAEQFVYYTPLDSASYSVDYVKYSISRGKGQVIGRVVGESSPETGPFFYRSFKGSSSYLTFMGGDTRLTHIKTSASTGRRLLILKDSFGNAIPPYLFSSFDDIHVVDCRYFTRNIISYIADNSISDVLFVNNMTHAVSPATSEAYIRYLNQ